MMPTITMRSAGERDVRAPIDYVAALRAERLATIFRWDSIPTIEEETGFIAEREQLAKIYRWDSPLPVRDRRRNRTPAVVQSLR